MFKDINSNEFSTTETDRFYTQEWSVFVAEVNSMTGANAVARQLFFDARSKYLSGKI